MARCMRMIAVCKRVFFYVWDLPAAAAISGEESKGQRKLQFRFSWSRPNRSDQDHVITIQNVVTPNLPNRLLS